MNLIDVLIILFLISSIARGARVGSLRQIFSTIGFIGGLFLGSWIAPHFNHFVSTPVAKSWLTMIITVGSAILFMGIGEYIGVMLKKRIMHKQPVEYADRGFGGVVGAATLLATVWLGAAILSGLPSLALQNELRDSSIVSFLDNKLPPAPNVIADLGKVIDPNGFPKVFTGNEPAPANTNTPLPSLGSMQAAVSADQASVVKIEGTGCGGVVEGSGFVVAPGLVATNAHVVAGVYRPYVVDSNGTHSATPVWFDPNLDFAVLSVNHLAGQPLKLDTNVAANGTSGAVLGYPGGGPFDPKPAAVLNSFTAIGRSIYGQGQTYRKVYEIKATVIPGNSGGPLIEQNGSVIGVVFAESTTYNQVGYALTANQITGEVAQAEQAHQAVSTNTCAE